MNILLHCFSRKTFDETVNAKSYAYWPELIELLKEHTLIQIGVTGEQQLVEDFRQDQTPEQLRELTRKCDFWISIDSFFPHFVYAEKLNKRGLVLWSVTNPEIFGYNTNLNLLQSRKNLRENQFNIIEEELFDSEKSIKPEIVKQMIEKYF